MSLRSTILCRTFWKNPQRIKQSEVGLKIFDICFCLFLSASDKNLFLQGRLRTMLCPIQFWYFTNTVLFPKILSIVWQHVRQLVYMVTYKWNQVPLYLWRMEYVLKLCKISNYYAKDCLKKFVLLFTFLKMIWLFRHDAILTQVRTTYQSHHQRKLKALWSQFLT